MNVLLGFAYKLTISRNSESPSQKHSGWKPKEMSHHFKLWEFCSVFIALLAFVKMRLFRSVWTIVGIPETNFFLIDSRTVGIRYRD